MNAARCKAYLDAEYDSKNALNTLLNSAEKLRKNYSTLLRSDQTVSH
jgi:hypothetical protein